MFSRHQYNCCLVLTIYVSWSLLGNGTRHFIISLEHHSCSNGKVLVVVFQLLSHIWLLQLPRGSAACQVSCPSQCPRVWSSSCPLISFLNIIYSLANVFILSPSIANTVMYPWHGFHIRKDFLPWCWECCQDMCLQLSDLSGFALSAEICFPPWWSISLIQWWISVSIKAWTIQPNLELLQRAIWAPDPVAQPTCHFLPAPHLFFCYPCLLTPADLPQVLIARALFNDTLLTKLHLRICFLRNLL